MNSEFSAKVQQEKEETREPSKTVVLHTHTSVLDTCSSFLLCKFPVVVVLDLHKRLMFLLRC